MPSRNLESPWTAATSAIRPRRPGFRNAADEVCRRHPDVILFQEVWLESLAEDIVGHCQNAGYAPVLSTEGGRTTGGLVTLYRTSSWSSRGRLLLPSGPTRLHGEFGKATLLAAKVSSLRSLPT